MLFSAGRMGERKEAKVYKIGMRRFKKEQTLRDFKLIQMELRNDPFKGIR